MDNTFAFILVDSTSHALAIEKLLLTTGIQVRLVPVPRHLSSDCGVCVRINREDAETARSLIAGAEIAVRSIETG